MADNGKIMAAFLGVGTHMWGEYGTLPDTLDFDERVWEAIVTRFARAGGNMILLDVGEGVVLPSVPELAVKGAWTPERVAAERERLAAMGRWMRVNARAVRGCTAAPDRFAAPDGTKLTYNPALNRLYIHLLNYPIKVLPLSFADSVAYAQFLHDGSEVKIARPLHVSGEVRKDVGASLHLPVAKPDVEIPVVELFLK